MRLCDALVIALQRFGVSHLFGVGGANIEHVFDAVQRLNATAAQRLEPVLCKSEIGAAFMADGQARLGHTLGVCCATSGGGMMNLAVGIAESRASGVPVLALVGLPPQTGWGRGAFQDSSGGHYQVDARALWQSICKYSVVVNADNFWLGLRTALSQALNGHPGPCALLLPRDCMTAEVGDFPYDWPETLHDVRAPIGLSEDSCERIWEKLDQAQRPVVVAGEAVDQCEALVQFAHRRAIPVVTTLAATAAFPHSNPHFAGVIGVAGHRNAHAVLEQADLVMVFGCQLELMVRAPLESSLRRTSIIVIHHAIDMVPEEWQAQCVIASPRTALAQLAERGSPDIIDAAPASRLPNTPVKARPVRIAPAGTRTGLALSQVLFELQHHLHGFDQIFFDAGNCAAAAAHYLHLPEGACSRIALGMGGMGYAICAAIGARMGSDNGRSLVVCGDGAFLMTGLEIHTAIERRLPILWLVCNDSQHGMCTSRQRYFFEDRFVANRYDEVDVWQIAAGLSPDNALWTGCVRSLHELEPLLKDFLRRDGPGVLEVKINVEEVPPFFPLMNLVQRLSAVV